MARATVSKTSLGNAALAHAAAGRPVFPCRNAPGTDKHKTPLTPRGFKDATTDPDQIRRWWKRNPDALLGMPTGAISGIDVVDLDRKNGKDGFLAVPDWRTLSAVVATTGSGGAHLYFRASGIRCTTEMIAPGVDTRGDRGYVIVPPSPGYAWIADDWASMASIPARLRPSVRTSSPADKPPPLPDSLLLLLEQSAGHGLSLDPADLPPPLDPERARAALAAIPADCDYRTWFEIGCALKTELGEAGWPLFDEWSSRASTKYGGQNRARDQWDRCGISSFTAGTLFHHASRHDPEWRTTARAEPTAPPAPASRVRLFWPGEEQAEETRWRIKNRLPEIGTGLLSGQHGTGKTFTMLDLAYALACARSWTGERIVAPCGTLVVAAESPGQIPLRLRGLPAPPGTWPLAYVKKCPKLLDGKGRANPKAIDDLVEVCKAARVEMDRRYGLPLGLLALDTIARVAGWLNENDAAQCQAVINVLSTISADAGIFVLGIDHHGKDPGRRTRGGSPKEDYADTVLGLYGGERGGDMIVDKQRDGPDGIRVPYRLRTMELGRDRDGDLVTTCAIDWGGPTTAGKRRTPTHVALLQEAIEGVGLPAPEEKLRAAFLRLHSEKGGGKSDSSERVAWKRAVHDLKLVRRPDLGGAELLDWPADGV